MVTLAISGFSPHTVYRLLSNHRHRKRINMILFFELPRYISDCGYLKVILETMDPGLNRNTSPERLAEAAEAILEHLIDNVKLPFLSTDSKHKSWLQRTKPGKHTSTGSPRLASVCHTLCHGTLCLLQLKAQICGIIHKFGARGDMLKVLALRSGLTLRRLSRLRKRILMVNDYIGALLWLLPKAAFSQKIVLYSKRTFPRNVYQSNTGIIRRARKRLDKYITRVQNAKLEELADEIENGEMSVCFSSEKISNFASRL